MKIEDLEKLLDDIKKLKSNIKEEYFDTDNKKNWKIGDVIECNKYILDICYNGEDCDFERYTIYYTIID